ncbi:hypothetical protein ACVNPX_02060 [Staphylococcus aureus]
MTAFMNKNQNIRGYLASTNPVTVDNNGNVTLHYLVDHHRQRLMLQM